MKIKPEGKAIGRLYLLKILVANSHTRSESATDEIKLLYYVGMYVVYVLLCSYVCHNECNHYVINVVCMS